MLLVLFLEKKLLGQIIAIISHDVHHQARTINTGLMNAWLEN